MLKSVYHTHLHTYQPSTQCDQIERILKFFDINFIKKVGKIFGDLLGYFETLNF